MPEQAEVIEEKEVPAAPSMAEYRKMRAEGLTELPAEAAKPKEEEKSDAKAETSPESETGAEDNQDKKKSGGGFQRRIDKLTRELRETQTQLSEAMKGRERPADQEDTKPSIDQIGDGKAFKSYEDFVEALAAWGARQAHYAMLNQEAQRQESEAIAAINEGYREQVVAAAEKYEDFAEVVTNSKVPIPQGVEAAIKEMENGAEVAYHLGKHPELCERLCELSPLRAIVEIGNIAAKLNPETPAKKPESKKPAPITPVGGGSAKSAVPLEAMDMAAYRKARAAGRTA